MPVKERYWKNPEHHLKEAFNRRRRLVVLGLSHLEQLSPAAQQRKLIRNANWRRTHLTENKEAAKRYRAKVTRLFGSSASINKYRHKMLKAATDIKNRKAALKQYEREQTTRKVLSR